MLHQPPPLPIVDRHSIDEPRRPLFEGAEELRLAVVLSAHALDFFVPKHTWLQSPTLVTVTTEPWVHEPIDARLGSQLREFSHEVDVLGQSGNLSVHGAECQLMNRLDSMVISQTAA